MLAILESGATDTIFFTGMGLVDQVTVILHVIKVRTNEFHANMLEDYDTNDLFGFLLSSREFKKEVNLDNFKGIYKEIISKGEYYEFTRLNRMVSPEQES